MLTVSNVTPSFKNTNAVKYPAKQYNPYAQQQMMIQKEADKKDRWQKAGVLAQIGLAAAFVTMAITGLMTHKANKKMLAAQTEYFKNAANGGNRVEEELKALTDVAINWTKFEGKNKVASLTSETTSKEVKDKLIDLLNISNLSDIKKQISGTKDRTRLYFLYGESGVGKTYVAKQFAQEAGAEYMCIKYGDIGSPYKDAGSMKILNMFKNVIKDAQANPNKKYVLCVDEIDALIRSVSGMEGAEASKARSSVLTGMDEIVEKCKNVTVIATSNYHPDGKLIDKASMRRFNKGKIHVPLPDKVQTKALLKMYLKDVGGIKDGFYDTPEFTKFVDELVSGKYANGEIQNIAENAADEFAATLVKLTDEQAQKATFKVDFLKKGKDLIGQAAAITNETMRV